MASGDLYGDYYKNWCRLRLHYDYYQDTANNRTIITFTLYAQKRSGTGPHYYGNHQSIYIIRGMSDNALINGTGDWNWPGDTELYIGTSTYYHPHLEDGTPGSVPANASWISCVNTSVVDNNPIISTYVPNVPTIPRGTTVTISQRSKTHDSISVNWSTANARDYTQYKINNGSWLDAHDTVASDNKSGYFTIPNLNADTTYSIQVRCKRADTQVWSTSNTLSIKTNPAQISISTTDIDFGENPVVSLVNPAGLVTTLVGTIDSTEIVNQTIETGDNTITFTDEQLTTMFKKYGDISQSNTITMVLTATASNGSTSTANLVITFTGDRATVWINDSGSWKKGICWIKDNGTWKKGIAWKGVNGTWKKAL